MTSGRLYTVYLDSDAIRLEAQRWTDQDQFMLEQATATHPDLRELVYNGTLHGKRVPDQLNPLRFLAAKLIPSALASRSGINLLIAPHGRLHQLPFHALPLASGPLVERFVVSYLPNLQAFTHLSRERLTTWHKKVLICGVSEFGERAPTLRHTRREVQAFARLYPAATVLWQDEAKRETILEWNRRGALSRFDILHFATHAILERDAPHWSRILLGEGELNVVDLADLNLEARLVTLSGCSSAVGKGGMGDETIGLARALFYAGARAVVASLWRVEDASTAALMTTLYRNLAQGMPIAAALREAQLELHRAGATPYHWAAFTASGDV